jgi:hypothetical protein
VHMHRHGMMPAMRESESETQNSPVQDEQEATAEIRAAANMIFNEVIRELSAEGVATDGSELAARAKVRSLIEAHLAESHVIDRDMILSWVIKKLSADEVDGDQSELSAIANAVSLIDAHLAELERRRRYKARYRDRNGP